MWRSCACFLFFVAAASGQGPAGDCRTPLGVPCYTIHYENSQWQNAYKIPPDIRHYSLTGVHAVRRDGSSYSTAEWESHVFFQGSKKSPPFVDLYLAPQDLVVRIFHKDRTFSSREPLIWHDRPYRRSKDGDANCSSGILHSGTDFRQTGWDTVLGLRAAKWERGDGRYNVEEIYLAPALDCAALKGYTVRRTSWFLPKYVRSFEATSIEWGEPKAELFAVPADYRQVEDPSLPRLLEHIERQKRFSRR